MPRSSREPQRQKAPSHLAFGVGGANIPPLQFHGRGESLYAQGHPSPPAATGSLSINVSERLQHKILSGAYVDLHELIDQSEQSYALEWNQGPQGPSLVMQPKRKRDIKPEEWSRAFLAYMYVYTKVFKEEAPAMLVYMNHILKLMQMNAD